MNRMEMFFELKKDPTKRFRNNSFEYFVDTDEVLKMKYLEESDDLADRVMYLNFESKEEYTEVKKSFKDRVKVGDEYFMFDTELEVDYSRYGYDFIDDIRIYGGNFFETKEECEEAIIKIKELLKG